MGSPSTASLPAGFPLAHQPIPKKSLRYIRRSAAPARPTRSPPRFASSLRRKLPTLPDISNNVGSVKSFFERTSPFTPVSGLPGYLRPLHRRPRLVRNLSIGFSPTQTSLRSVLRPRLLIQTPFAGSGMPIQVDGVLLHAMSGTELSRVRTELHRWRILAAISPHPVQADSQPAPHRYLGNTLVPSHRQVNVPTSPVRIVPRSRLRSLHQQEAQQRIALLADVPEPLLLATGVLTGDHPHVVADLLATMKSTRSPDDQHVGQCRKRAHARMGHQPQYLGPFPSFLLR